MSLGCLTFPDFHLPRVPSLSCVAAANLETPPLGRASNRFLMAAILFSSDSCANMMLSMREGPSPKFSCMNASLDLKREFIQAFFEVSMDWLDALLKNMPKGLQEILNPEELDFIPAQILAYNVNFLMGLKGIKRNTTLASEMEKFGFELHPSQIGRLKKSKSDCSISTVLKLSLALGLPAEDFSYLLHPAGFDSSGKSLAKTGEVDSEELSKAICDALDAHIDEYGIDSIDHSKIAEAVCIVYKAAVTNDKELIRRQMLRMSL